MEIKPWNTGTSLHKIEVVLFFIELYIFVIPAYYITLKK